MNCGLVRRFIGAYVDGELDPASQIDFERHLAVCSGCQEVLAFERVFRHQLREVIGRSRAPDALRDRICAALAEAPPPAGFRREPALIRVFSLRARYAVPVAALAAVAFVVIGSLDAEPTAEGGPAPTTRRASALPLFQDVARIHRSELPPDIRDSAPQKVSDYLRTKVHFPVQPASFEGGAELVGGRVTNVRDGAAAALYYETFDDRRMTVVVTDRQPMQLEQAAFRFTFGNQTLYYQRVSGYTVPVRQEDGLAYYFIGELDRDKMIRMARTSRLRH
jgi:anti-sigma factor RsiW